MKLLATKKVLIKFSRNAVTLTSNILYNLIFLQNLIKFFCIKLANFAVSPQTSKIQYQNIKIINHKICMYMYLVWNQNAKICTKGKKTSVIWFGKFLWIKKIEFVTLNKVVFECPSHFHGHVHRIWTTTRSLSFPF